jgi:hypothetical protein
MSVPELRAVTPDATPEEIAAIVAALGVLQAEVAAVERDDTLHEWVRVGRLQSRRSGLHRGPWRLSGRVSRRSRA